MNMFTTLDAAQCACNRNRETNFYPNTGKLMLHMHIHLALFGS